MKSAFVLAGGIHHHKHFQNRGVTAWPVDECNPAYPVTRCSLNKADPTAFLWVLCFGDVWPHAEKCPGELPISKLYMMENVAWRIHFYNGRTTVSSMHSDIPKLEYIPLSFNFLPFFPWIWVSHSLFLMVGGAHYWNRGWWAWRDDTSLATCPISEFGSNSLGSPGETDDR